MRVSEIIRSVLNLIDQADAVEDIPKPEEEVPNEDFYNDEVRRMRQIVDVMSGQQATEYANSPAEEYAGIEAVTTAAGGGPNNSKHPSDLRVKDPSMYPNKQEL